MLKRLSTALMTVLWWCQNTPHEIRSFLPLSSWNTAAEAGSLWGICKLNRTRRLYSLRFKSRDLGPDTDFPSGTQRLKVSTAGTFKTPSLPVHLSLRPNPCWCLHSCLSLWPWKEDWTKWHMNQMEAAATSFQASDLNDWKTTSWFLSASLEVGRAAVTKVGMSF